MLTIAAVFAITSLLQLFVMPHLASWPVEARLLLSAVVVVLLLGHVAMPLLTRCSPAGCTLPRLNPARRRLAAGGGRRAYRGAMAAVARACRASCAGRGPGRSLSAAHARACTRTTRLPSSSASSRSAS